MKKKKIDKFIVFVLVLVILKQLLMSHINIIALGNSGCDDQLMIKIASNLLKMNWLGSYNHLTHVKGMFFPFFLAVSTTFGISYINAVTLLYSISCIIFVNVVKDLFKNKYMKYILFTVLLFNPIMYTSSVVQRVYRNSLTPSQVLLILSSFFYMFINRKNKENKKMVIMSVLGGITLGSFYNTREDAIWIIPFVLVFTLIMIIEHIIINKNKFNIKRLAIFLLPIITLYMCNTCISLINYKVYGAYVRIDEANSSFSRAIDAIYSVPPKEEIEYVSVTREKLNRIYEISPTLNSISTSIDKYIKRYDTLDRNPDDNEVDDGWFWWVLRYAAYEEGYYKDIKTTNKFYENVASEIEKAEEIGKIEKQKTMFSSLMSPWRKGYTKKLFNTMIESYKFTNSFKDTELRSDISSGSFKNIGLFETLTNDKAIYPYYTIISGTYNAKENEKIMILYDNNVLRKYECNLEKCYIEFISNDNLDNNKLFIKINDEEYNLVKLAKDNYIDGSIFKIEDDKYNLNYYSNNEVIFNQQKLSNIYIKKLNIISKIYQIIGLSIGIISLLLYLVLTVITLFKTRKNMDKWLIISSVLCSYLVLCLGVSYNHISSCYSITTLYLSGSYPLIIIFDLFVLFTFIDNRKKACNK